MSDTAEAGSVVVDTPPAGAPAQPTETPDNGSAGGSETPFSGLQDEGARKWVETKGYKSTDDVVKAARSLEERLGTTITPPKDDSPEEAWQEFYRKLPETMRPVANAESIEFKLPEGYPQDVPYNEDFANAVKPAMAEAKLSARQSQIVHDVAAKYLAEQALAQQSAIAQSVETTHDDLVKDWGPVDSEGFKAKLATADRAMKQLGLTDAFKGKGVLLEDGALTDPQIARAFEAIGNAMFREDTIGADGMPGADNPFKRDASGNRNLTAISALVKNDPDKARRLAREAGENPDLYMPNNPL